MRALLSRKLPHPVKLALRRMLRGSANPYISGVRTAAAVSDLYFWMADDANDTVLLIENYFSRLFPDLDTRTEATIQVYDAAGTPIARDTVAVGHMATPARRLSQLLAADGSSLPERRFGNVIWHLAVPDAVRARMAEIREDMLFWDRGYIGYTAGDAQIAFIHGIDKSMVVRDDGIPASWPVPPGSGFAASPELPVEFSDYEILEMIVQNRASRPREIAMQLIDRSGGKMSWSNIVQPRGVARFRLDPDSTKVLDHSAPLRLRFEGLPTRFGRPIALKRFRSGQISLMHC